MSWAMVDLKGLPGVPKGTTKQRRSRRWRWYRRQLARVVGKYQRETQGIVLGQAYVEGV